MTLKLYTKIITIMPFILIFICFRLKINIEGCKNNLNMSCMAFYANYGGDGRNYTARAVYECFFDPNNGVITIKYYLLNSLNNKVDFKY